MNNLSLATAALVAAATFSLAGPAAAQDILPAPFGTDVRYAADSGPLDNPGEAWRIVYSHEVRVPTAASIRLHFAAADLAGGSFLLVTSMLDGEQHRLDAAALDLWRSSTAYFNGDTLLLELHAAPGAAGNLVRIERLEADFHNPDAPLPEAPLPAPPLRGDSNQCGICGTDDRIVTNLTYSGRLMPVGCTASIICEDNSALTAGHCMDGSDVLQFNVPASLGNCFLVNPPVADQFPVIAGTRQGVNGGVGNDWGVFRCGNNNQGQGPFQRYGELRRPAAVIPPNTSIINIFGYGIDLTCARNQVQQRSGGTITGTGAGHFEFNADVRGGNSGSGVISGGLLIGIVSHCSTACGNNIATRIDLPTLRTAMNQTMVCDNRLEVRAVSLPGDMPISVPITVSPADTGGAASGTTPFDRSYNAGAFITLTAPDSAGALCFEGWRLNGIDQLPGLTLTFPFALPVTATALYSAAACCPADWNDDGTVNSSDISAFLTSWLASVTAPDLVADFNEDGTTNSSDISAFLTAWLAAVTGEC